MAGDRIVTVDGEVVAGTGVTNKDVQRLLKGPKGTLVTVGISEVTELLRSKSSATKSPFTRWTLPSWWHRALATSKSTGFKSR